MKLAKATLMLVALMFAATAALGDWDPGQSYKMHYPQLPDPQGWDVRISEARLQPGEARQWVVADDFECIEDGPINDVHFWVSWEQDFEDLIVNVHLSIHENIPVGPDGWSIPGQLLWEWDTGPGGFAYRKDYGVGIQGWYDPPFGDARPSDHFLYHQINITEFPDPFWQTAGDIYWLDISVDLYGEGELGKLGWKTSRDHWMDHAVYWDTPTGRWVKLDDPITGDPIDMAFVITPEPATMVILGFGAAGILARRRRA